MNEIRYNYAGLDFTTATKGNDDALRMIKDRTQQAGAKKKIE